MQVGFAESPSSGGMGCERQTLSWEGRREDQLLLLLRDLCSDKGEMVTIRNVNTSVPTIACLPCFDCLLDWKSNPDMVESINKHGKTSS